ncbi:endonuclease/exonuclease/phosphatase family protein [Vibrio stylophorae]|uniref:endonuclease/exonuclease/phosphatase family protein n=1 Tax=Vibrio stylophorae TaxID=659351 RepID=UPI0025B6AE0F|nr:endonuclease/exonuclease/phosphatase family protein [Vibrio stylophorae]
MIGLVLSALSIWAYTQFQTPSQTQVWIMTPQYGAKLHPDSCYFELKAKPLDRAGELKVLSWNIYKGQRDSWAKELQRVSVGSDLVLLQEVRLSSAFLDYLQRHRIYAQLVRAFDYAGASAGVMTLSTQSPVSACGLLTTEPLLRLPKSLLVSEYPLTNGQRLLVVNLHSINFSMGMDAFETQLGLAEQALLTHKGPMILAGDFNTWRDARVAALRKVANTLGLIEVDFTPDARMSVFGHHLDHMFYRGLQLIKAEAPTSDASDHNPMVASFHLLTH